MNQNQISDIIQLQRTKYRENSFIEYDTRMELLTKVQNCITKYEKDILNALSLDLGKPSYEAQLSEIIFVQNEVRSIKKNLKKWMKKRKVKTPLIHFPAKSYIRSEAYGSVLIIAPWNYPFQLLFSPLIGAIAAGNRVVLKPSEISENTSHLIKKIIDEVFEEEYIACVEGGVEETTELLDGHFDYIFYTGNAHVGRIVMEKASKNLTPVTLELGGKSPTFVFGNSDLELVAKRIVSGKFFNAGQTCIAPDYVLVDENKYEELVNKLIKYIEKFYGEVPSKSKDYGRIINESHFNRLLSLIETDSLLCGGNTSSEKKFIPPTLVSAKEGDLCMKDEIFGPILPIMKMENLKSAIDYVTAGEKPLAMYIFSNDSKVQEAILNRVSAGGVTVNDTLMHITNEHLPFGGVGHSGMGSYHGENSFDLFSHKKSVFKASTVMDVPVKYPPYFGKIGLVRWLMRFFG
ncbi:aldehyde dehydrogenase family protein [Halobacteriovorax sp.]|uniref:aldehyde dehydrogenase family protein n=1 Tax=Halobacteriovorax sp. TaxID=2020862 RepID=UPI003564090C